MFNLGFNSFMNFRIDSEPTCCLFIRSSFVLNGGWCVTKIKVFFGFIFGMRFSNALSVFSKPPPP